jgi:hypothetical protein
MPIFHPLHATNLINILNIKFEYFNHACMHVHGKKLVFRTMDECEPFRQHDDANKTHKLKHSNRLFIACNECYIQNHDTLTHVSSSLALYTTHA